MELKSDLYVKIVIRMYIHQLYWQRAKICRKFSDFKKRELRKYGTTQIGSPETTKSCKAGSFL